MTTDKEGSKETVLLVDVSSYLHRAYHAFPPLTAPKGEMVGGVYGTLQMLSALFRRIQPAWAVLAFDPGGETARMQLDQAYKEHRLSTPPALKQQASLLRDLLQASGVFCCQQPGEEADDLIATLVKQAGRQGRPAWVATQDKDLFQLLRYPHCRLLETRGEGVLGREEAYGKFHVWPEQMGDYLALIGDASDNIPGVSGIGPKTATALLQHFGSLEALYEGLDQLLTLPLRGAASVRQKLWEGRGEAFRSRALIALREELPLPFELSVCRRKEPDFPKLLELFERYGFKREAEAARKGRFWDWTQGKTATAEGPAVGAQEAQGGAQAPLPSAVTPRIRVSPSRFLEVLEPWESLGVVVSVEVQAEAWVFYHRGFFVTLEQPNEEGAALFLDARREELKGWIDRLSSRVEGFVVASIKDWVKQSSGKARWGTVLKGAFPPRYRFFEPKLMAHLLDSQQPLGLETLLQKYLPDKPVRAIEEGKERGLDETLGHLESLESLAVVLMQAHLVKFPKLLAWYHQVEAPLAWVLAGMELEGIALDEARLEQERKQLEQLCKAYETEIFESVGETFNLRSPKQLQKILFETLKLPKRGKTPKGGASTNEETLLGLASLHPVVDRLLKYREVEKLRTTYAESLKACISPESGRIHTTYHQTLTATGRLSSSKPNLQNIPIKSEAGQRIRRCFVAEEGYRLVSVDYDQIELKLLAVASGEVGLLEPLAAGTDVHRHVASEIFHTPFDSVTSVQRRKAKSVTFGLIYGMSPFGLAKQLRVSHEEAKQYFDRYFQRYPSVLAYLQKVRNQVLEEGYVETFEGRRWYAASLKGVDRRTQTALLRAAVNAPIQGSAAEILKRAMVALAEWMGSLSDPDAVRLLLQIHDELVFEVREAWVASALPEIRKRMEESTRLSLPLRVTIGVGAHWAEIH